MSAVVASEHGGRMATKSAPAAIVADGPGAWSDLFTCIGGDADVANFTTSPACSTPGCVYRYYDADGVLIYIGVTKRGVRRNLEHASSREWWPFVASQEVEHFDTYEAARSEERRLIFAHRPPFNKQHNPWYEDMHAAYLAHSAVLVEAEGGFVEMYRALGRSLPLRVVSEPSSEYEVTLASYPEHWAVARTLTLPKTAHIQPFGNGQNVGFISSLAKAGGIVLLRGRLKAAYQGVSSPVARLKVVTLKRPEVVRVTGIEVEAIMGASL